MRLLKEMLAVSAAMVALVAVFFMIAVGLVQSISHLFLTTTEFPGGKPPGEFLVAMVEAETAATAQPRYSAELWGRLPGGGRDLSTVSYLLPEPRAVIPSKGDRRGFQVLEDHGKYQLVEVYFSNTHAAWCRYRAYADRIEPVSYRTDGGLFLVGPLILAGLGVGYYASRYARRWVRGRLGLAPASDWGDRP